jgi:hypothetical protein
MTQRPKMAAEIVRTLIWKEIVLTHSIIDFDGFSYKVLSCTPLMGYSHKFKLVVQRIFKQ